MLIDPHRAGHERTYFPGEANLLRADVLILAKLDSADPVQVEAVRRNIRTDNPQAVVIDSRMPLTLDQPGLVSGKRVLAVEDGPTLTHGGMGFGAGALAAKRFGASELVDPRSTAVGSLRRTLTDYPHIGPVLPAMGYGAEQIAELEATINATPCDLVLVATPVNLARLIAIRQPTCRVTYEFEEIGRPTLQDVLSNVIAKAQRRD